MINLCYSLNLYVGVSFSMGNVIIILLVIVIPRLVLSLFVLNTLFTFGLIVLLIY